MSSLACNVYFTDQKVMQWGDLMGLNFENLQMQKWKILTDRAQKADDKNEVISLVIMFTLKFMVNKKVEND